MASVRVTVRFIGNIREAMGKEQQEMQVSPAIEAAAGELRKEMIKAAPDLLYTMLINGSHYTYAMNQGVLLKDGDELSIIPVMLGG